MGRSHNYPLIIAPIPERFNTNEGFFADWNKKFPPNDAEMPFGGNSCTVIQGSAVKGTVEEGDNLTSGTGIAGAEFSGGYTGGDTVFHSPQHSLAEVI